MNRSAAVTQRRSLARAGRTYAPKPEDLESAWHVIDAENLVLGRMASSVASLLMGKHKTMFARNVNAGDHVVIVNAKKVALTGRKRSQKVVYRHSGYPGGLREELYVDLLGRDPRAAITRSVAGMLPKNKMGRSQLRRLHVYGDEAHPHVAQNPQPLHLTDCTLRPKRNRTKDPSPSNQSDVGSVNMREYKVNANASQGSGLELSVGHGEHQVSLFAEIYREVFALHWRCEASGSQVVDRLRFLHDPETVGFVISEEGHSSTDLFGPAELRDLVERLGDAATFLRVEAEQATYIWRAMSEGPPRVSILSPRTSETVAHDVFTRSLVNLGPKLLSGIADKFVSDALRRWEAD